MSFRDDLVDQVHSVFVSSWSERDGQVVPEPEAIKLGNDGVNLDGVCLYADMADSSKLVETRTQRIAAEIFKAYLHCASKIIQSEGGVITSFDGDRVMGIFIGDSKNTSAARAALKIKYAVTHIVNPEFKRVYSWEDFVVNHAVGIDGSPILAARTGVRGANDLVWVGTAANQAAKLSAIREGDYSTFISKSVYDNLNESVKFSNGQSMWEARSWNGVTIYRSNYWWTI